MQHKTIALDAACGFYVSVLCQLKLHTHIETTHQIKVRTRSHIALEVCSVCVRVRVCVYLCVSVYTGGLLSWFQADEFKESRSIE